MPAPARPGLSQQSARDADLGEPDVGYRAFGARAVGTDAPNTIQPGLFIGKGFGDLPDSLSWLRPFAITAAFVDEVPRGRGGMALAPNPTLGRFDAVFAPAVETLHWGFSIQFSTLYPPAASTAVRPRASR